MNEAQKRNSAVTPLDACLLVDYRLGTRTTLKEYIIQTEVFGIIHDPGSLGFSLPMIASQHVDTCIFGPSVKAERIKEFILSTQLRGESKLCAFIAFRRGGNLDEISNAHVVLEFPKSQQHFNVSLVKAITAANNGAIPHIERIDPVTRQKISLSERLSRLDFPPCDSTGSDAVRQEFDGVKFTAPLIEAITGSATTLFQQLLKLNPLALKFTSDGSPSDYTVKAIRSAINNSFNKSNQIPGMREFSDVLEALLYEWAKRGALQGRAVADFVLRRELREMLLS